MGDMEHPPVALGSSTSAVILLLSTDSTFCRPDSSAQQVGLQIHAKCRAARQRRRASRWGNAAACHARCETLVLGRPKAKTPWALQSFGCGQAHFLTVSILGRWYSATVRRVSGAAPRTASPHAARYRSRRETWRMASDSAPQGSQCPPQAQDRILGWPSELQA